MTLSLRRATVASMVLATALAAGACGSGDVEEAREAAPATTEPGTVATGASSTSGEVDATPLRTPREQEFLDELSDSGIPTDMTASTTVEVGIGICQSIADGADDDTILDRIRPFTSAIAAQDPRHDSAEVGHNFVDASRTHLCD